jgi:benzoyl-CoA reductase/2-hydroxyglutaryl-CoA dehydratase subunit BcrC/BadD/HgdB
VPDEAEARSSWRQMIVKLQAFLEKTFDRQADFDRIETVLQEANRKNALMQQIFDYAACNPPALHWTEIYDVGFLALPTTGGEIAPVLELLIGKLEDRVKKGEHFGRHGAPRILVTGCPIGGDATRIFKVIEAAGGVVVAPDACTGMKAFSGHFAENSGDPIGAMADRYLQISCACMTPNNRRIDDLSQMIDRFKPDAVIDVILQACHSYNVESYKIGKHVAEKHGLPFLKVEIDYSDGDIGQLRTRVEALLESA